MSFYDIKVALDTKLSTLSGSYDFAWENVSFKPTIGTAYIRPFLLFSPSTKLTFEGLQQNQGIYQVDVVVPVNKGMKVLLDKMDDIFDLFREEVLTSNSSVVHVTTINSNRFSTEQAWMVGTVDIYFTCYE